MTSSYKNNAIHHVTSMRIIDNMADKNYYFIGDSL